MEHLKLIRTELLTVIINFVEVLWCGADIDPTPYWLCLIERSYDLIDVIYHADLESTKVVVKLALVGGNFSWDLYKYAFKLFLDPCDRIAHQLGSIVD